MRRILGARLVFGLFTLGAIGLWVACGGSDHQEGLAADAGGDTNTTPIDSSTGFDANKDTGSTTQDAGKIYDAGVPNLIDGGAEFEGGIPCVVGGDPEEEPNDDTLTANELKPTRCGAVLVTDGGPPGGESD